MQREEKEFLLRKTILFGAGLLALTLFSGTAILFVS